ncbi:MAG: poly-gamma-glutamate hydrolase family protein [Actinomycetota bacterium]|nr:poly-gamma-glutamate hydrolase family protein [Actinomycetota bacterium]
MLASLLARPEVTEVCELRGRMGLMAYHGGNLERSTDAVAREVAERTGASLYAVLQQAPLRQHVSSLAFDPAESDALACFLSHVDVAISIHGYGRETSWHHLLIGGRNRALAGHVASHLRAVLSEPYEVVDDLERVPKELRGQHPRNPVNRPAEAGVQIELPPTIRWNRAERGWSDHEGVSRSADLHLLIDGLSRAVSSWDPEEGFAR